MTNNKWIRPALVGMIIAGFMALMGWSLAATANMPKEYATKIEVIKIESDVDKRQTRIESKLDDIKDLIIDLHK